MPILNLREAFRYQNFLDTLENQAAASMGATDHRTSTTVLHKRHAADPTAEDIMETADPGEFIQNDILMNFRAAMAQERAGLAAAVNRTKSALGKWIDPKFHGDLDAALAAVKAKRMLAGDLKRILSSPASAKTVSTGTAYRINVEGNQVPYKYEMETIVKDNFDRDAAKAKMKELLIEADAISAQIDMAMVSAQVDFTPAYDVNGTLEDAVSVFGNAVN